METKFKETKIGWIPEEWEVVHLGDFCERITKGTTPTSVGFGYQDTGINFIKVESIDSNGNFLPYLFAHINNETHNALERSIIKEYDLLFSIAGALGRVALANNEILPANTNQALGIIRLKQSSAIDVKYLYFYLKGPQIQKHIQRINVQSAQANLTLAHLNKFRVLLPPLPEQRKIAEILSTVDDTIEKTDAIIQETQQLKKGLMQKLFTEGIGHTRFKEWDRSNLKGSRVQISAISKLPESWVVKRIGDLAKDKKGAIKIGPFGSQLRKEEMVESGVSVFGQENVFNKDFKIGTYFISSEKYEKLKSVELFARDIVLTMMGTIGDCCVVPPEINTGIMDSHLMRIQVNESVNPNYISRLIRESYIVKKQVECLSQGAIMSGLNLTLVKDIYLPIPPIAEQAQIEEILSEVDTRIRTEQAYKAELEQLKKGLMQVLLTGKNRVKV